VNDPTAQDASGPTITAWDDLTIDPVFTRRALARPSRIDTACPIARRAPSAGQEAVDAAGPVDAQTAPTAPWKTADGFPQAPTAILVSLIKEKDGSSQPRPATGPRQSPSSAAVASGAPLPTLRRQK
jgi:hypothetical protein